MIKDIVLLGSGNIATHLAKNLSANSFNIIQVFSRNINNAKLLAEQYSATATNDPELIIRNADLHLICLSDTAIENITNKLKFEPNLIAHTAGSVPLSTLKKFNNHGVFYPMQSFSKNRDLDFTKIPVCIEANSHKNEQLLLKLAETLTTTVKLINSDQRKKYHLAAVFANNFANHMFAVAKSLLDSEKLDFNLLKPLIIETAMKVQNLNPEQAQTGPAVRNNQDIIKNHLQELSDTQLEKLYSFVTESIISLHNKEQKN